MRVQFRAEYPTQEVVDFLDSVDYPHEGWTVEMLQRIAFLCRIQTVDRKLVGYCWYTDVPDSYRIKEFHVAIDAPYRGRWINRDTNRQVLEIARLLDAQILLFSWRDPVPLSQMTSLGWTVEYPFAWRELENGP